MNNQNSNVPATAQKTMELINGSTALQVPEMELVKNQYIQNYNVCNPGQDGSFMYQRNMVHLMQILNSSDAFRKCTPFSVYRCLTTIAAYGYSIDPADDHIYLIPREGQLCISKQAGAKLLRLYKTKQIIFASQAELVYEGDDYIVKNGLVIDHTEHNKSDKIIAGYVKFTLDESGTQRHIRYKISDWETWRLKSPQATGGNWRWANTNQPYPGFLRKKIMLHACGEGCWIPGNTPIPVDVYDDVIIDANEEDYEVTNGSAPDRPAAQPAKQAAPAETKSQAAPTPQPSNNAQQKKEDYTF